MEEILKIENLKTYFFTGDGVARAVDGVSVGIDKNKILGLVGESGCGKSVTALSILRLIPSPPGRIVGGKITLSGREILSLPEIEMRDIRGMLASLIFEEPMTSLNPVYTIGTQIMEAVRTHTEIGQSKAREIAME
jgi:ABC-type dipeptide/oligopeptide/nickel transport system ATPase component